MKKDLSGQLEREVVVNLNFAGTKSKTADLPAPSRQPPAATSRADELAAKLLTMLTSGWKPKPPSVKVLKKRLARETKAAIKARLKTGKSPCPERLAKEIRRRLEKCLPIGLPSALIDLRDHLGTLLRRHKRNQKRGCGTFVRNSAGEWVKKNTLPQGVME